MQNSPSEKKWKRIGTKKRSGILVPLFSVYSKESLGIGDLSDLKLIIDWAKETGNSIVQLLPMNEMGPLSCPYDAISSFALEPAYIVLREIPCAKNKSIISRMKDLKKAFPAGRGRLDYRIKALKLQLLWDIYRAKIVSELDGFIKFKEVNAYWLEDFALYKVIKGLHKGTPWYEWSEACKNRDKAALEKLQKNHANEIEFQRWVQWQLYRQFKEAARYAKEKNVLLKGDLPFLVSRDSADVWAHREFFKLDFASGAPTDMYCAKGQRWGMPPYNWEAAAADNYQYLKEKFKFSRRFYDILRIDHVVGLFRIWSIPYNELLENQGLNGFFDPQDESKWLAQGKGLLTVILESTDMLLCAEDLGVIPQACTDTLKDLGIPGTDVQRWAKDWKVKHDFLQPKEYRALSVAALSTHDTTNWPAWWENEAGTVDADLFVRKCSDHRQINFSGAKTKLFDLKRSRRGRLRWQDSIKSVDLLVSILGRRREELADFIEMYENTYQEKEKLWKRLSLKGRMREECDAEILTAALKLTLESNSVFCINTIIDWLYLTEAFERDPYQYRINTPGTTGPHNWSLTIPISLDELSGHKINKLIRGMIKSSGRI